MEIRDIDVQGDKLGFTVPNSFGESAWSGRALLRFLGHVEPATGPCPVPSCSVTIGLAVPPLTVTVEQ